MATFNELFRARPGGTRLLGPPVLAPTAILTPSRLRARELARARAPSVPNESPATRELRAFLDRADGG